MECWTLHAWRLERVSEWEWVRIFKGARTESHCAPQCHLKNAFSCRRNSPVSLSGWRIPAGKLFQSRGPAAAKLSSGRQTVCWSVEHSTRRCRLTVAGDGRGETETWEERLRQYNQAQYCNTVQLINVFYKTSVQYLNRLARGKIEKFNCRRLNERLSSPFSWTLDSWSSPNRLEWYRYVITHIVSLSPIFIIVIRTRHSLSHTGWWNLEFRSRQIAEFLIFSRILYILF